MAATFFFHGVVRAVLPELGIIVLTHTDIPGYMPGMTMGFRAITQIPVGLSVGDAVRFSVRGIAAAGRAHGDREDQMRRRLVLAGLAALLLRPAAALAHAVLVKSVPAQRAVLVESPPRVELWFNERLEPAYSKAAVTNEAGARVDLRDVAVSGEDARRLGVSLPPLAPGRYTVNFRVLSVDGHIVESTLTFTVTGRR